MVVALILLSCETGAEYAGASLLWDLSRAMQTSVRARTGLTFWDRNRYYFEKGSTWQWSVSIDEKMPEPIARANTGVIQRFKHVNNVRLSYADLRIGSQDIYAIDFSIFDHENTIVKTLQEQDIHNMLPSIFASPIFENKAEIAGILTMNAVMRLHNGNAIIIDFYNSTIAKIPETSSSFYCAPDLQDRVMQA